MAPLPKDSLEQRLHELRSRWKRVLFVRGLIQALAILITALLVGCLLDYLFELPLSFRYALAALLGFTALAGTAWFWIHPLVKPISREQMAWLIEQSCPHLGEKLISSVELEQTDVEGISSDLIARLLDQTGTELGAIKAPDAFPLCWRQLRIPIALIIIFLITLLTPGLPVRSLLRRVTWPSPRDPGIGAFKLDLIAPRQRHFIEGDNVVFVVNSSDPAITQVRLYMRDDAWREQSFDMNHDPTSGHFSYRVKNLYRPLQFWAKSGKVSTAVFDLDVTRRPKVELFTFTVTPPEYTDLPAYTQQTTNGNLKVPQGSLVAVSIDATKPLSTAEFIVDGKRIQATIGEAPQTASFSLHITETMSYRLLLRDEQDLGGPGQLEYTITTVQDEPPVVVLKEPSFDLFLSPDDRIPVLWQVQDDYGIKTQEIVFSVNNGVEQFLLLSPGTDDEQHLNLAELSLRPGDELRLWVRARDTAEQTGESNQRLITVVASHNLRVAGEFLAASQRLQQQLQQVRGTLLQISITIDEVRAGDSIGVRTAEDLAHSLTMLTHQLDRLDRQLLQLQRQASLLQQSGFFPYSRYLAREIYRRLRHHRVFELQRLSEIGDGPAMVLQFRELLANIENAIIQLSRHGRATIAEAICANMLLTLDRVSDHSDATEIRIESARHIQQRMQQLKDMLDGSGQEDAAANNLRHTPDLDMLRRELQAFYHRVHREAGDYSPLTAAHKNFGESRPPFYLGLHQTSRDISLYDSARDWQIIGRAAAEYRMGSALSPDRLADEQLLSDALEQVIKERSIHHLNVVIEAIAKLDQYHELRSMEPRLVAFERAISRQQQNISELLKRPSGVSKQIAIQVLDQLHGQAVFLHSLPVADRTLDTDPTLKPTALLLIQAEALLTELIQAVEQDNTVDAGTILLQATDTARAAHTALNTRLQGAQDQRNLARKSIRKLAPPASYNLRQALAMMNHAAAGDTLPAVSLLNSVTEAIQQTVENLKRSALAEIQQAKSPLFSTRPNLLLAAELNDIHYNELQSALAVLREISRALLPGTAPGGATGTGGDVPNDEQSARIKQQIRNATRRIQEILPVLEQLEAAERGELSPAQTNAFRTRVNQIGRSVVPNHVLTQLDALSVIRNQQRNLEALSEGAKESHSEEWQAEQEETAALQGILNTMQGSLPDQHKPLLLAYTAHEHLALTRESLATLQHEVRKCYILAAIGQTAELQQGAKDIADAQVLLQRHLSQMEGFRGIFGYRHFPAYAYASDDLAPQLEWIRGNLNAKPGPAADLHAAAKMLNRLHHLLDTYAEDLSILVRHEAVSPRDPSSSLPRDIYSLLDSMKFLLTKIEVTARSASRLEAQVATARRNAIRLLDALAIEYLSTADRRRLEENRRRFDQQTVEQQIQSLSDTVAVLGQNTPMTAALRDRTASLTDHLKTAQRAAELRGMIRQDAEHGVHLARQLLRRLAGNAHSPQYAELARITGHLKDNLRLSDFPAARINLHAISRDLTESDAPGLPERTEPANWPALLRETGLEDQVNEHALRGLSRATALSPLPPDAMAAAIVDRDFAAAATFTKDILAAGDLHTAADQQTLEPTHRTGALQADAFLEPRQLWNLRRTFAEDAPESILDKLLHDLDIAFRVTESFTLEDRRVLTAWPESLREPILRIERNRTILGASDFPLTDLIHRTMSRPAEFRTEDIQPIADLLSAYQRDTTGQKAEFVRQTELSELARFLVQQTRDFDRQFHQIHEMNRMLAERINQIAGNLVGDEELKLRLATAHTLREKAAVIRQFAGILQARHPELADELEQGAVRLEGSSNWQEYLDNFRRKQQAITATATKLNKMLEADHRPAARQARAETLSLSKAMDERVDAGHALPLAEKIEAALTPTSPILAEPMLPRFAFEAIAAAAAAGERRAVLQGWAGDYKAASGYLNERAAKTSKNASFLRAAALKFDAAQNSREMETPPALQAILQRALATAGSLPYDQQHKLIRAVNFARLHQYNLAATQLNQLPRPLPEPLSELINNFSDALTAAFEKYTQQQADRFAMTNGVADQIRTLSRNTSSFVRAELAAAETALLEQRREDSIRHLQVAEIGMPLSLAQRCHQLRRQLIASTTARPHAIPGELDWFAWRAILRDQSEADAQERLAFALAFDYSRAALLALGPSRLDYLQAAQNRPPEQAAPETTAKRFKLPLPAIAGNRERQLNQQMQRHRILFIMETIREANSLQNQLQEFQGAYSRNGKLDEQVLMTFRTKLIEFEHRRAMLGNANHRTTAVILPTLEEVVNQAGSEKEVRDTIIHLNMMIRFAIQGFRTELANARSEYLLEELLQGLTVALAPSQSPVEASAVSLAIAQQLEASLNAWQNLAAGPILQNLQLLILALQDQDPTQARSLARRMATQLAELRTIRPRAVPLHPSAFAAGARAARLENHDALANADIGDYLAAAASLRTMPGTDDASMAAYLETAIQWYDSASAGQLEMLPAALANTVLNAEARLSQLPPAARLAMQHSCLAIRTGDLQRAAGHLRQVEAHHRGRLSSLIQSLKHELYAALQTTTPSPALLRPTRHLANRIKKLEPMFLALPKSLARILRFELQQAVIALDKGEPAAAAARLRGISEALSGDGRATVQNLAMECAQLDHLLYGDANRPAREGLRMLSQPSLTILNAVHHGDYRLAAELARESDAAEAAQAFLDALHLQRRGLPARAVEVASNQAIEERLNPIAPQIIQEIRNGRFFAAANAIQVYLERTDPETVRLLKSLETANNKIRETQAPYQKAMAAVKDYRFSQAAEFLMDIPQAARLKDPLEAAEKAFEDLIHSILRTSANEQDPARRQAIEEALMALSTRDLQAASAFPGMNEKWRRQVQELLELADSANTSLRAEFDKLPEQNQQVPDARRRLQTQQRNLAANAHKKMEMTESLHRQNSAAALALIEIQEGKLDEAIKKLAEIPAAAAVNRRIQKIQGLHEEAREKAREAARASTGSAQRALANVAASRSLEDAMTQATAAGAAGSSIVEFLHTTQAEQDAAIQELITLQKGIQERKRKLEEAQKEIVQVIGELDSLSNLLAAKHLDQAIAWILRKNPGLADFLYIQEELRRIIHQTPYRIDLKRVAEGRPVAASEETRMLHLALAELYSLKNAQAEKQPHHQVEALLARSSASLDDLATRLGKQAARQIMQVLSPVNPAPSTVDRTIAELLKDGHAGDGVRADTVFRTTPLLSEGASSRTATNQDQYYRQANLRYLEWLARESRKWQEDPQ